ncbi:PIN domain-containing protein [Streptomyces cyaneofuscatus]|uniref:PIN domain-containing protein n=1 Tax=Streptomyces cyaneofuscatus TaxID=66883 RepID=UPI0033A9C82D
MNDLVSLELEERSADLEATVTAIHEIASRWAGGECLVVADSSFYIQNPERLELADLQEVLGLLPTANVRLLFPIVVVDELDGLKDAGKHRARYRAVHTLGQLDATLRGSNHGSLRAEVRGEDTAAWRGGITAEIILDGPGHVRLPLADDEIVDRTVAMQALAGREVMLLTCDTGQHTRARAAGLRVIKVPATDPGPEPDWSAQDKPGTGARAMRREKRAAANGNNGPTTPDGRMSDQSE